MKFLKVLSKVAQVAGPIAATVVGGPALGGAVVAGMGAAGLTKKAGQKIQEKNGTRPHMVAAPFAGVAVPAVGLGLFSPDVLTSVCDGVSRACDSPYLVAMIPGLIGVLSHQLGGNISKVVAKEKEVG